MSVSTKLFVAVKSTVANIFWVTFPLPALAWGQCLQGALPNWGSVIDLFKGSCWPWRGSFVCSGWRCLHSWMFSGSLIIWCAAKFGSACLPSFIRQVLDKQRGFYLLPLPEGHARIFVFSERWSQSSLIKRIFVLISFSSCTYSCSQWWWHLRIPAMSKAQQQRACKDFWVMSIRESTVLFANTQTGP